MVSPFFLWGDFKWIFLAFLRQNDYTEFNFLQGNTSKKGKYRLSEGNARARQVPAKPRKSKRRQAPANPRKNMRTESTGKPKEKHEKSKPRLSQGKGKLD